MAKSPNPRDIEDMLGAMRGRIPRIPLALLGLLLLCGAGSAYWWFVQRVEIGADELCVLVRKVGRELPESAESQVVLYPTLLKELGEDPANPRHNYKGVIYEPLPPGGRYFRDPFFWSREIIPITNIAQDEVGILVRKFGKPLPEGRILASQSDDFRGPLRDVLPPGRHPINTLAYEVLRVQRVTIPPGHVGVQTLLSGDPPTNPNVFVVKSGEAGVQPDVLAPGLYPVNPYERRIDVVDLTRHTLDFRRDEAIDFPSKDSFTISVEATVEYSLRQDMTPYMLVAIGDHAEIVTRIILPVMRSLLRIEGSKLEARDFIAGESRSAFQTRVFDELRRQCGAQGIEIAAALIRHIEVPQEIAGPISDRQFAQQSMKKYESETKLAQSEAKKVEQTEMQKQNQAIGEANRSVVATVVEAEQRKSVALTEANQRLEVAKLTLEAARQQAQKILAIGQADAEVLRLGFEAKARPLGEAVAAFGDGESYAQYHFFQKLAPSMKTVLDSTEGPFAEIFRALSNARGAPPRPTPAGKTTPADEQPEKGGTP
ncbi:MAG: hypothetical protein HZB38_13210 [Planctomycetes bacterium]|nr:hypothetical protein [Planctomycetota bacterium]